MSSAMSSAMSSPTKSEFDEKETGQAGLGLGLDEDKEYVDKEKNSSEPSSPSPQVQVLLKDDPHAHAHTQIDNTPLEHGHEPLPPAAEAVVDPILRSALATEIENGEPATGIVLSPIRQTLLCAAMTLTYFIGSASGASVIFIIPAMSKDLGVSTLAAQWVASAQSLAWGCGLLFAGRLADMYSRKFLFLLGLSITLVFTLISGAIPSLIGICIVRALAGLGTAIATPASFGICGVTFRTEPTRTVAFAVLGMGNPIGGTVGMILGGIMASIGEHGWRLLFYVLGGLCVIPIVVGFLVIPSDKHYVATRNPNQNKQIDWLGGFLVTAGVCLLAFSLTQSGIADNGWKTPYIPALLALSVILLVSFVFWEAFVERRTSIPPVAKLSLFTRNKGQGSVVLLMLFFIWIGTNGTFSLISLFYQEYQQVSPIRTTLYVVPAPIVGVLASIIVIYLVPRVRAPFLLATAGLLTGICAMIYAVEPEGLTYWAAEFIGLICLPFGPDMTTAIGSIIISNLCDDDEQSVMGALLQTTIQVGQAIGLCVASLIEQNVAQSTGSILQGLRTSFFATMALSWITIPLALIFLGKMGFAQEVRRKDSSSKAARPHF